MPDEIPLAATSTPPASTEAMAASQDEQIGPARLDLGEPALGLDETPKVRAAPVSATAGRTIEELEARIRKLEAQYVALQDTKVIEERVAQKVTRRLRRGPETQIWSAGAMASEPPPAGARPAGAPQLASKPTLLAAPQPPAAQVTPAPPVAQVAAPTAPVAAVVAPLAKAVEVPVAKPLETLGAAPVAVPAVGWRRWLRPWLQPLAWLDALNELRVILRLFGDPRYQMSWKGRLVPLAFLVVFFCSDIALINQFFPWNWLPDLLSWPLNKLVILLLGFASFKVLALEIRRYQQTIPDAPGARMAGLGW